MTTLEQFAAQCREAITSNPGTAGREKVRDLVQQVLATEVPAVHFHAPEATYLGWLDCSRLELPTSAFQFFLDHARIGFSAGETFDPNCTQFVRFNFATSMPILEEILDRFVGTIRQTGQAGG